MPGEAERRAEYERLFAEVLAARRALEAARARGADAAQLRRLRERLKTLQARLAAWQLGNREGGAVSSGVAPRSLCCCGWRRLRWGCGGPC